jgi:hypothetical protein
MLVTTPVISAEALTIFMALLFLIGGCPARLGLAGADGILTFILGILVFAQWPDADQGSQSNAD